MDVYIVYNGCTIAQDGLETTALTLFLNLFFYFLPAAALSQFVIG